MRDYLDAPGPGVTVIAQDENKGPRDVFLDPASLALLPQFFCVTDPDLLLNSAMPDDFLAQLAALTESLSIGKAGLAFDISDRTAMRQEDFLNCAVNTEKFGTGSTVLGNAISTRCPEETPSSRRTSTHLALYNKRFFETR